MDNEGNIVLPIDDLQLETLREGEVVTLPHSASLASLATAGKVATVAETSTEMPPDICEAEETASVRSTGKGAREEPLNPRLSGAFFTSSYRFVLNISPKASNESLTNF